MIIASFQRHFKKEAHAALSPTRPHASFLFALVFPPVTTISTLQVFPAQGRMHMPQTLSHKIIKAIKVKRIFVCLCTHLCYKTACVCCSLCVLCAPERSGQPILSVSLPLRAGVKCVWERVCVSVSPLTGYCYREGSQTEHAPTWTALAVGMETGKRLSCSSCEVLFRHTQTNAERSAGRCWRRVIILATLLCLINPSFSAFQFSSVRVTWQLLWQPMTWITHRNSHGVLDRVIHHSMELRTAHDC